MYCETYEYFVNDQKRPLVAKRVTAAPNSRRFSLDKKKNVFIYKFQKNKTKKKLKWHSLMIMQVKYRLYWRRQGLKVWKAYHWSFGSHQLMQPGRAVHYGYSFNLPEKGKRWSKIKPNYTNNVFLVHMFSTLQSGP